MSAFAHATTTITTGPPSAGRWAAIAGAAYVAGSILGLFVAPSAPGATADAATVHAYYLEHGPAILAQSLLVHGLAGIALAVLAVALAAATRAPKALRRLVVGTGVAAGAVSLTQVGFAVAALTAAAGDPPTTTRALFESINIADTVKLVLIAGFAATATLGARRAGMAPAWVSIPAAVLVPLLPIGGAAFLVENCGSRLS